MFAFLTAEVPVYSLGSFEICNQITSEFSVSSRNRDYAPPKRRSNDTLTRKPQKVLKQSSCIVSPKPVREFPNLYLGSINPEFGRMPDGRPVCPVCHATFSILKDAKRHFQSKHSGVTFKCEMCGCELNRKDVFKNHLMRKHSMSPLNAKVLKQSSCIVSPKPVREFPNLYLGSINPEFGRMPDGRPVCPVCHATFSILKDAKRHFQSKHSGVTFKCEMCGCELNRKDVFKNHLMRKHSMSPLNAKVLADNIA
ncbi:zinc finger protein 462-like isoform X2 [Convolutriloba macropyga]|uniref:zinc finger protein 462-like isoform X2 n=1 Tax=Convolutriloba macropyga TaxID=536237 RepID=UPI003F51F2AE